MKEFVTLVANDSRGLAILVNLVDAVDQRLIDSSFCAGYLKAGEGAFRTEVAAGRKANPALAYRNLNRAVRPIHGYGERGAIESDATKNVRLDHVAPLGDVIRYHFPSDDVVGRLGIDFDQVPLHELTEIAHKYVDAIKGIGVTSLPTAANGCIGNPRRSLWMSPGTDILDHSSEPTSKLATRVRDAFGLIHVAHGTMLLAYTLVADRITLFRPTPIEADGRRFRVLADVGASVAWGMSVDLARLRANERNVNGVPEVIAVPLRLTGDVERQARESVRLVGDVLLDEFDERLESVENQMMDWQFTLRVLRERPVHSIFESVMGWL